VALSASFFLAVSALIQWVLAQDGIAVSGRHRAHPAPSRLRNGRLLDTSFRSASCSPASPCRRGLTRRLPRWMMVFGIVVAAVAELSSLGLVFPAAMVLLPLARFPALVWNRLRRPRCFRTRSSEAPR